MTSTIELHALFIVLTFSNLKVLLNQTLYMDLKIARDSTESVHSFERYAQSKCQKYFDTYPFVNSFNVFLRGTKHPTKKVKLQVRLQGKELFASATGNQHHDALNLALDKVKRQLRKYKTERYGVA